MSEPNRSKAVELSMPLPQSLDTRIYLRLSMMEKALFISLATTTLDDASAGTALGSFVYALPDRFNPQQPLSTVLFISESSLEFTTRLAKIVAKKLDMPIYVTNSMSFVNAGMGGTVEEEMQAFKNILDVILSHSQGAATANGA